MRTPLEQAIVNTIAWFDVVSYPLTPREISRFLYVREPLQQDATVQDIERVLMSGTLAPHIVKTDVFWHVRGREDIVATRRHRFAVTSPKWMIAEKATRLISWLPFVRMVAVVNTVSYHNAKEDSDIDLFIVIEHGRMFLARWFITMILDLFHLRRHGIHVQDRACLSFYISDKQLSLEHLKIPGEDPYLTYWHEWLTPLYSDHQTLELFYFANRWVKHHLPNAFTEDKRVRLMELGGLMTLKKRLLEKLFGKTWFGHVLEAHAQKQQMQRFDQNTQSRSQEEGSAVVISDTILKFHETDRRDEFRERHLSRLREFVE
ncbi:MAG: hypothetical protein WCV86_00930 [Patescibacteria group bacterium]|jgi:hypothetical protein